MRKLKLTTLKNHATCIETDLMQMHIPGCRKGDETEDNTLVFDLSKAIDSGTPSYLSGPLEQFWNKMQQNATKCYKMLQTCNKMQQNATNLQQTCNKLATNFW